MTSRHYVLVVACVVFGISLCAFLMLHAYPHLLIEVKEIGEDRRDVDTPTLVREETLELPRSLPVRLRVPAIGIDAAFETPLSLNRDGTIGVPHAFDTVGWYQGGAAPGERGTASILGHVDSYAGAAVFYSIGQIKPGDRIFIDRADGTTAEFVMEYLERYKQSEFPTEKVYGMTEYPSLRLITCSGTYDKEILRYTHNTVVYARLSEPVSQ